MINLQGTLINAFRLDGGKGKDGKEYEARDKVQILGSLELPNGEIKHELVDLTVEDARIFEPFKNKVMRKWKVLFPLRLHLLAKAFLLKRLSLEKNND